MSEEKIIKKKRKTVQKKVVVEVNPIKKFIEDNGLDFSGSGSDLNSNCCIIAGYALYLDMDFGMLLNDLDDEEIALSDTAIIELDTVFNFAEKANYGKYWETEEAKKTYKF